jgi:hypothetical protein
MSRWGAELGNHLVSDVGPYDIRGSALGRTNQTADANALRYQSIIIPLPSPSFDLVYAVCAAGYGVAMGATNFPTASAVGSSGLGEPTQWRNGAHAMAWVAAIEEAGTRYIYLLNSHGHKYAADKHNNKRQGGCWCNKTHFQRMSNGGDRFGPWYANIGEIVR